LAALAKPFPPAFGRRIRRPKVDGAAVMSFPANIIPPAEFLSIFVKKCKKRAFYRSQSEKSENSSN
jgi:hypothetical protein